VKLPRKQLAAGAALAAVPHFAWAKRIPLGP